MDNSGGELMSKYKKSSTFLNNAGQFMDLARDKFTGKPKI